MLPAIQVVMLPYPDTKPFHGMNRYTGEKDFFEKRIFPVPEVEGGCTMTLLEVLALLTLVFTVIYEAVDITLKIMQYIDEKHNKKD